MEAFLLKAGIGGGVCAGAADAFVQLLCPEWCCSCYAAKQAEGSKLTCCWAAEEEDPDPDASETGAPDLSATQPLEANPEFDWSRVARMASLGCVLVPVQCAAWSTHSYHLLRQLGIVECVFIPPAAWVWARSCSGADSTPVVDSGLTRLATMTSIGTVIHVTSCLLSSAGVYYAAQAGVQPLAVGAFVGMLYAGVDGLIGSARSERSLGEIVRLGGWYSPVFLVAIVPWTIANVSTFAYLPASTATMSADVVRIICTAGFSAAMLSRRYNGWQVLGVTQAVAGVCLYGMASTWEMTSLTHGLSMLAVYGVSAGVGHCAMEGMMSGGVTGDDVLKSELIVAPVNLLICGALTRPGDLALLWTSGAMPLLLGVVACDVAAFIISITVTEERSAMTSTLLSRVITPSVVWAGEVGLGAAGVVGFYGTGHVVQRLAALSVGASGVLLFSVCEWEQDKAEKDDADAVGAEVGAAAPEPCTPLFGRFSPALQSALRPSSVAHRPSARTPGLKCSSAPMPPRVPKTAPGPRPQPAPGRGGGK